MKKRRRAISKHLRVQVLARDGYRCLMCGRTKDEVALHVDHVRPLDAGGTDELSNLATLCTDCNLGKGAYLFSDYQNVRVVPDDLESRFTYLHDDPTGDFERFHLYCYYRHGTDSGGRADKFHHTWTISGTQWQTTRNQKALEARRRSEESAAFAQSICKQLLADRKRLVVTEEGLCAV